RGSPRPDKAMTRLGAWMRRNRLDVGLWTLFVASTVLMLKSSSDRLPAQLRGTAAESLLSQFPTGNQIVFDITGGVIVSLILYVFIVRMPESSKRRRVRQNLRRQYDLFKEATIQIFLWTLHGSYNTELVDRLKDRDQFRSFFDERVSPDQTRWDAVLNG